MRSLTASLVLSNGMNTVKKKVKRIREYWPAGRCKLVKTAMTGRQKKLVRSFRMMEQEDKNNGANDKVTCKQLLERLLQSCKLTWRLSWKLTADFYTSFISSCCFSFFLIQDIKALGNLAKNREKVHIISKLSVSKSTNKDLSENTVILWLTLFFSSFFRLCRRSKSHADSHLAGCQSFTSTSGATSRCLTPTWRRKKRPGPQRTLLSSL